jgi:hypothetical protein
MGEIWGSIEIPNASVGVVESEKRLWNSWNKERADIVTADVIDKGSK